MTRQPSLARNVISNWLALGTGVVVALLVTPVVVRTLEAQRYGVWSFLNGLLAYSDLLYLGLGSSLIKSVAQARANDDLPQIRRLASVVLTIYAGLGLLCLFVLVGLSRFVPLMFAHRLPAATATSASYVCMLLGVRLLLAFVSSGFSGLLCGYERYDLANCVTVGSAMIRLFGILVFVPTAADPLLALALVTCATAVAECVGLGGLASWYVPELSIRLARPRLDEIGPLYHFGIQSFFVLLSFKLISYTDTTVIGFTLGASSVALYTVPLQLVEYARISVGGFAGVFLPRLAQLTARNDVQSLREAYVSAARITCFLAGWIGALVFALGPTFLTLWIGPEFGSRAQPILLFLTIGAFASAISTQAPLPFYQALHSVGRPALILTIEAVSNLALSIWLAFQLGIVGVALATALPAVLVSAMLIPPFLCRRLELSIATFFMASILPGVAMLGLTGLSEWGLNHLVEAHSYATLAVEAVATVPLAVVLVFVSFPAHERRSMLDALRWHRRQSAEPG